MIRSKSLLRREEYRALCRIRIDGRVLDVGGVRASGYQQLFQGEHKFTTANLSPEGADLTFDAQQRWPIEDLSFDAVLFLNVLEHLYEYRPAVMESWRVLVPGGRVIVTVPFMFNVHGSPNDHFRYTKSTLERLFADAGFVDVAVAELGTGAFSVIYHCLLGFIPWNWLGVLIMPLFTSLDRFFSWVRPGNHMSATYMPLGYLLTARRPSANEL